MNSDPQHLSSEDRRDFERLLDEALRSAPRPAQLPAEKQRLNAEQLRTMALGATALITAAATSEYQHYVKVREEARRPTTGTPSLREGGTTGSADPGSATVGLATTVGEVAQSSGAGVVAVVAVLAPVLAGTAAAIFLLVGYVLKMLDPEPAIAQTLLTSGWVFGAVTAAAILVAGTGLLITALRNNTRAEDAGPFGGPTEALSGELADAREAWLEALLERGIRPFLQNALDAPEAPATASPSRGATPGSGGRIPQLGYHRPGFSSRPEGAPSPGTRPRFSSPDFTSPEFGGPEHRPD